MAESERFDEGITSWDIPSVLIMWIHGDIGSSSFSQVIWGGGSAWRYQYQINEIKCEVYAVMSHCSKHITQEYYMEWGNKTWTAELTCKDRFLIHTLEEWLSKTYQLLCLFIPHNKFWHVQNFLLWQQWSPRGLWSTVSLDENMKCRKRTNSSGQIINIHKRRKLTTYCWDSLHTPLKREGLDPLILTH